MNTTIEKEVQSLETAHTAEVGQSFNIHREITSEQICVLTFDRLNSSANIFDAATLQELNDHLGYIERHENLKGVIFTSAKKSIFIAGADLHALSDMACKASTNIASFIELGQKTFNRISRLTVPTVAAIHGACVGGGYELCLACHHRIASPDRATKIGLPEVQLGILPAWGGSTRLPRLIGLPKALGIILAGKTLAAKPALKTGLVDELAPKELLVNRAVEKIVQGSISTKASPGIWINLANNPLAAGIISSVARSKTWKKTRGHYPAPLKALDVIRNGISRSTDESLKLEANAILELADGDVARNLIRVFFLQERAKKLSIPGVSRDQRTIGRTAVIGAGVMGAGIAQWLSARGLPVILRDINADAVGKGMNTIAKLYKDATRRHVFSAVEARRGLDNVSPTAMEVPLRDVDIIIEAAVEKMDLKKAIFRRLDEISGPKTILATNTSALSISELATSTQRPDHVVGIHFFNPVHKMQLVEVVAGEQTSPEVLQRSVKFVQQLGKLPVVVKDRPGFLVNRILMPYLMEAVRLFEGGADIQELDDVMLDFGMPMGPLRLIDEVGVDVSQHVAVTLAAAFRDRLQLPHVLERMMKAKLLGKKSQAGFHLYHSKKSEVNRAVNLFRTGDFAKALSRERLQEQMVFLMINEAARCLEEKVVEAPEDVDFAMIMGTGFAPFRGGPLRYADSLGVEKIVREMKRLVDLGERHFAPSALLENMAKESRGFYAR